MLITPGDMSNTIPDEKVTATFIGYLAVRLLDLSRLENCSLLSVHTSNALISGKSKRLGPFSWLGENITLLRKRSASR